MKRLEKKPATALPLWLIIPAVLFAALLLAVLLLSGRTQPQTAPGLVTAQQAVIHTAPEDAAATGYTLPQSTPFTVLEEKDGWYRTAITYANGQYGWLKATDVTLPGKITFNGVSGPAEVKGLLVRGTDQMADGTIPAEGGKVALYAGPGNTYGKAAKHPSRTVADKVLSYENGWFRVSMRDGEDEGYIPADQLLLDTGTFIVDLTAPVDDGKQDDTSSTDDGKQDDTSSTDDSKKDETSSTDDGKQDDTSSTDDGKKDETSSTDDGKKDEQPKEEEKKPPVALPSSSTSVLAAGVISDSAVRLRKGTGTDTDIITEMDKGVPVKVFDWKNGWYKIEHLGKTGYVSDELIKVYPTTDSLKGYAIVDTDALNMRAKPTTDGKIVTVVEQDDVLTLQGFQNGWFKVKFDDKTGYVSGDYVKLQLKKPAEPSTSGGTGTSAPSGGIVVEGSGTGAEIAAYAQTFLGVPYVWGGTTPDGFDCSGFIQYVYKHFGYSLPRGSNAQLGCGTAVSKSELQPGDIIFFCDPEYAGGGPTSHAGIYIGSGKFIHASTYNGNEKVQIHPLSNSYYTRVYTAARRIVG